MLWDEAYGTAHFITVVFPFLFGGLCGHAESPTLGLSLERESIT